MATLKQAEKHRLELKARYGSMALAYRQGPLKDLSTTLLSKALRGWEVPLKYVDGVLALQVRDKALKQAKTELLRAARDNSRVIVDNQTLQMILDALP